MKIFEKIKIKLKNGKSRQFRILEIPVFQYDKIENQKIKYYVPYLQKRTINKNNPVFYLKVNRNTPDTFINFQYWVDIVKLLGADFYIICDNINLERKLLSTIVFADTNITFIKSQRNIFYRIVKKQKLDRCWKNAAYAHLTTFWHSKKNGYKNFWNIDADDALFLVEPEIAADFLKIAKSYAEAHDIDALGFDFWATKTKGRHWSFGITYTRNSVNYLEILNKNIINWGKYKNCTSVHNIDWIFSHLKNIGQLNLKTFYIENLYFLHWGRFFGDIKNAWIVTWNKNYMEYPILSRIFNDKRGIIPIIQDEDILKLEYVIDKKDCLDFAIRYLMKTKYNPLTKGEILKIEND